MTFDSKQAGDGPTHQSTLAWQTMLTTATPEKFSRPVNSVRNPRGQSDFLYVLSGDRQVQVCSRNFGVQHRTHCTAGIAIELDADSNGNIFHGATDRIRVTAIKPKVDCSWTANGSHTVVFLFGPAHFLFPRFRRIAAPGILTLSSHAFAPIYRNLTSVLRNTATNETTQRLFNELTQIASVMLPRSKRVDSRVAQVLQVLSGDENHSLQTLAEAVNVSYFRLSHLFAENLGITLRAFQQRRKLERALFLLKDNTPTLAAIARQAGFVDAAHLGRVFAQVYGLAPSHFLRSSRIKVF